MPVVRREAAVTTATTTGADPPALGAQKEKGWEPAHTSGLSRISSGKGQGSVPKPHTRLALPLARQCPCESRGKPGNRLGAAAKSCGKTSSARSPLRDSAGPTAGSGGNTSPGGAGPPKALFLTAPKTGGHLSSRPGARAGHPRT
nr:PREDICTED: homeobox protein Nkx-6.1-like [Equus przewalskii]